MVTHTHTDTQTFSDYSSTEVENSNNYININTLTLYYRARNTFKKLKRIHFKVGIKSSRFEFYVFFRECILSLGKHLLSESYGLFKTKVSKKSVHKYLKLYSAEFSFIIFGISWVNRGKLQKFERVDSGWLQKISGNIFFC